MKSDLQKQYNELQKLEANAKHSFMEYEKQLEADLETELQKLEDDYATKKVTTQQEQETIIVSAKQEIEELLGRLHYAGASLTGDVWENFSDAQTNNALTDSLRVGVISREFPEYDISEVPVMLPLINNGHILVVSEGDTKKQAYTMLQNLVLRAFLMLGDGNTEFILIDPVGMGANLPFTSLPDSLRGEMVYAEEDEILVQLRRLTDQIRKGNADKRYVLCVADFPKRFNEDALQRMLLIAQQGLSANVYMLAHVDSDIALPDGFDPSPLLEVSSTVFISPEGVQTTLGEEEYNFIPDPAVDKNTLENLLQKVRVS